MKFLYLRRYFLYAVSFCFILFSANIYADSNSNVKIVPRKIIVLYDSSFYNDIGLTTVHNFAEMHLNHLGLILEYHPLDQKLPDINNDSDVRGVLTWFHPDVRIKDPIKYLKWAKECLDKGKKFVIIGKFRNLLDI